jgi:hypothetical protein
MMVLLSNIKQKKIAKQALIKDLFWKNSAGLQYKNDIPEMVIWLLMRKELKIAHDESAHQTAHRNF